MRYVDLAVLRTLTAVVEEQTFAKAAGTVHRTQAAVSQQMRKLEEQLGVRLFQRSGRNNEFTPEGLRVADYAKRLLLLHDEMMLALRDEESQHPIRIGAPADLADSVLPVILRRCSQIIGPAPMEIHVGRSPFLLTALREGSIDLTISTRWDQTLSNVVLRTSPVVWIASDGFKLDRDADVPLVLADEPSIFRKIALDALERTGRKWTERYTSPNLAGIQAAVRAGLGVTARSMEMVGSDMKVLGEHENLPPLGAINFYLYMKPETASQRVQTLFRIMSGQGLNGGARSATIPEGMS